MDLLEKKTNPWISRVKQYQLANSCTYAEALKLSKSTYKKANLKAEDLCTEVVDVKSFAEPVAVIEESEVLPVESATVKKAAKSARKKSAPIDIPTVTESAKAPTKQRARKNRPAPKEESA